MRSSSCVLAAAALVHSACAGTPAIESAPPAPRSQMHSAVDVPLSDEDRNATRGANATVAPFEPALQCGCDDAFEVRAPGFLNGIGSYLPLETLNASQQHFRISGYHQTFLRYGATPTASAITGELVSVGELSMLAGGLRLVLNPCRQGTDRSRLPVQARGWDGSAETPYIDLDVGMVRVELPSSLLRFAGASRQQRAAYHLTLDEGSWRYTHSGGIVRRDARGQDAARTPPCVEPMRVQYTGLTFAPDPRTVSLSLDTRDGALPQASTLAPLEGPAALVAEGGRFTYHSPSAGVSKAVEGDFRRLVFNSYQLAARLYVDEQADGWTPDDLIRALTSDGFRVVSSERNHLRLWTIIVGFEGYRA